MRPLAHPEVLALRVEVEALTVAVLALDLRAKQATLHDDAIDLRGIAALRERVVDLTRRAEALCPREAP